MSYIFLFFLSSAMLQCLPLRVRDGKAAFFIIAQSLGALCFEEGDYVTGASLMAPHQHSFLRLILLDETNDGDKFQLTKVL